MQTESSDTGRNTGLLQGYNWNFMKTLVECAALTFSMITEMHWTIKGRNTADAKFHQVKKRAYEMLKSMYGDNVMTLETVYM